MRPVRLLYTIPNLTTAGSGRALYEIARRLDRRAFAPTLCVERRGGPLEDLFEEAGIPVLERPFTVPPRPLRELPIRVARAARALRGFDLWHSFHYLDDYTEPLVARRAGARWMFTKKNMSWNRRSWWLRAALARRIVAQNRDMLERFFAGWPLVAKTEWIPRGVDIERFAPPTPEARAEARAAVDLDDETLAVGCVAHLVPVKGHEVLLQAAARTAALTTRPFRLLVAGRGAPERVTELQELAEGLGMADRVAFLGAVAEVPQLLHALDVCVLPTLDRGRMEGCPVALLEAMASGLAVVATDVPGSRDVVDDTNGLRVTPGDAQALGDALVALLADEAHRARLGAAARDHVERQHPIALEVERHEAFYRQALGVSR
ncbi:MAG: glycosyltransferase [Acidobacteriota bacterium]